MEDPLHPDFSLLAIRMHNIDDVACGFETGRIPAQLNIKAEYFFCQAHIDEYQKHAHGAPRSQYVITLKGKLRFTVTDGSTFIIEPGIILIAEDVHGPGHTWELIDCDRWERIYIPFNMDNLDHFIKGPH
jgi:hypothetical protein